MTHSFTFCPCFWQAFWRRCSSGDCCSPPLRPRGLKRAALISSLTFGLGHIVNLLNGAALLPTLLQLCYACAIGLLFTVLFQKSGSLLPGILTHSLLNALSAFSTEGGDIFQIISAAVLTLTALLYTLWLVKKA